MNEYKFKLVYGSFSGFEKKATELISEGLSEYLDYPLPVIDAKVVKDEDLKDFNIIVIGTEKNNRVLKSLLAGGIYEDNKNNEGYSIKVTKSVFNPDAQMIIISGADENGVVYGAVDFLSYYIPYAENTNDHTKYFNRIFKGEELKEYASISSPSIKQRGIWTWGHVIYDYKNYIKNMVRLKMNTLIVWNDYVPVNIDEIINEAHANGMKIYLGFSWGWNEARPENGGLNIADEVALKKITDVIVENYEKEYSKLDIDGIYFQSFTETPESENNNIVIAERVVKLVNQTAEKFFEKDPDILLMFGLHATSVSEKLEYIEKTDKRIMIVWEDCGAFPYAYTPNKVEGFEETLEFSERIAKLRGADDKFGIVSKGLVCLDWVSFRHMPGSFVMGHQSESFIEKRAEEKKKLWKYVNAYWIKNAKYAYDMVKLLKEANENTMITALIEDGMFEEQIYFGAALYAEMMWDAENSVDELVLKTALRKDISF